MQSDSLGHVVEVCVHVCRRAVRLSPGRNAVTVLVLLVSAAFSIAAPVVLGQGIAFASAGPDPAWSITLVAIAYAATWFIGSTSRYIVYPLYGRLEQELQSDYMSESLTDSLESDSSARRQMANGEIGYAVDSEASAIRDILSGVYLSILPSILGVIGGFVAIWVVSTWYQATIFAIAIIVYLIVSSPLIRRHQSSQTEFFRECLRSFGVLNNYLALWREARIFDSVAFLRHSFRTDRRTVEDSAATTYAATRRLYLAQGCVLTVALVVLITLNGLRQDMAVSALLGSTVAVAGVCVSAISPLQSVGFGVSSIAVAVSHSDEASSKIRLVGGSSERLSGLSASLVGTSDPGRLELIFHGDPAWQGPSGASVSPLSPGRPHWLVGPSGGGKTTTLEEVLGLRGGEGVVVKGSSLPVTVAYLPQESDLLNSSALENVAFGRSLDGTVADTYLRSLGMQEFAAGGSKAESDVAGENGGASGGEARRICLARALAGNSTLVILDEPTASLDKSSRMAAWRAIEESARRSVVLVATHDDDAPMEAGDTVLRF